jgi:hypothetical protein
VEILRGTGADERGFDILMIPIPEPKRQRDDAWTTDNPCLICGTEVKNPSVYVRVWQGTHIISDEEAESLDDPQSDCGYHPIGPSCYRRHKKLLEEV